MLLFVILQMTQLLNVSDLCLKTVMEKLEEDSEIAITWF